MSNLYPFPGGAPAYPQSHSPYQQNQPLYPQNQLQYPSSPYQGQGGGQGQIQPGTITYTISIGSDGRQIYHPFRAELASYRTPQGTFPGIQWVPADTTYDEPLNAQPASADWIRKWARGRQGNRQDEKLWKEWQRQEEKLRRREEKEASRRRQEWDQEERERIRAEEKLARRQAREGRVPITSGIPAYEQYGYGVPGQYQQQQQGYQQGYQPQAYQQQAPLGYSQYSQAQTLGPGGYQDGLSAQTADLDRRMAEMELNAPRSRRNSVSSRSGKGRRVSFSTTDRPRRLSNNLGPSPYAGSGYSGSEQGYIPNPGLGGLGGATLGAGLGGGALSRSRQGSPNYGYANLPPNDGGPTISGRASPYQAGYGTNPILEPPEAFSRTPSLAHNYTIFDPMRIAFMSSLTQTIPPMPKVLVSHDVFHQDWIRYIQDLAMAWSERVEVPSHRSGRRPHRASIAADIIDVWNTAFFLPRGIETVLFKGRIRRSGPMAGHRDDRLVRTAEENEDDLYSDDTLSSDSSLSDESDYEPGAHRYGYGIYGRNIPVNERWMEDTDRAKRAWRERKRGLTRGRDYNYRDRDRDGRRDQWALYITCVTMR
ncbi:hypothetical protein SISNIDRAFT_462970 [Sistotremastrum niveocremeum HHB9708]|uniref:Uncharacterized protein n=1 Tax=Sistotremastrum niveocremeum HHB9708 TaxID=1314777 RepID=A0A164ZUG4_9AGAM|nr:hypothetical protein SISNIDRAFT_462970 [Sistotremastrum niveocremeum HHB9708]